MIQFTKEERKELKKRAARQPEVVARLKENVREVMERPVLVPKEGIANWTLYYYCPKCSVQLEFDWDGNGPTAVRRAGSFTAVSPMTVPGGAGKQQKL